MRESASETEREQKMALIASRFFSCGFRPRARDSGVALISALLMVALATVAAVAMASRQQLDIRRTSNILEYDQAILYVQGIEDWAGQVLRRDLKDGNVDSLDEDWATTLPPIPVDGGQLAGSLEDMQGRFNLNRLVRTDGKIDEAELARFRRLLVSLELPEDLGDTLADWLDADDDVRMGGAEQVEYLGLQPPYRAFNGVMASPSELMLVQGMTGEIYQKLLPYVAALPQAALFNVNTVSENSPELIMCLAPEITRPEAEQILENRGVAGFTSVQDFLQEPVLAGRNLPSASLTVSSSFFMVTSHVQVGRSTYTTYSLLERSAAGSRTVMRAQGIY